MNAITQHLDCRRSSSGGCSTPSLSSSFQRSYTAVSRSINSTSSFSSAPGHLGRHENLAGIPLSPAEGRFTVGRSIGAGAFGQVYEAMDNYTQQHVAVKFEKITPETTRNSQLMAEVRVYRTLARDNRPGIPRIYYFGAERLHNVMALDLLGPSLSDLLSYCRGFSLKTVLMLSTQLVRLVQNVHEAGYLHRDIKPDNFAMGLGDKANVVYLIDFGLAKKFVQGKTDEHIPFKVSKGFTGTARYASVAMHLGYEQSRKDELETLFYVIAHLGNGTLPWQNVSFRNRMERKLMIQISKLQTAVSEIMGVLPPTFCDMMTYVKGMGFEERPNYEMLTQKLNQEMSDRRFVKDFHFDWFDRALGAQGGGKFA
eukprot:Rhum_TRINITY_DN9267_c0_g1::Rhum_TRINITY_DN9267_c0_g1_i1::g.32589::m.32589